MKKVLIKWNDWPSTPSGEQFVTRKITKSVIETAFKYIRITLTWPEEEKRPEKNRNFKENRL